MSFPQGGASLTLGFVMEPRCGSHVPLRGNVLESSVVERSMSSREPANALQSPYSLSPAFLERGLRFFQIVRPAQFGEDIHGTVGVGLSLGWFALSGQRFGETRTI